MSQNKSDIFLNAMKWSALSGALFLLVIVSLFYRDLLFGCWQRLQNGEIHPAGLITAYVVLPTIGFPITPLLILLGVRFGSLYGSLIMALIMPFHLAVSFWAVRTRIQDWIQKIADAHSITIPEIPKKHQFSFSFLFMIIPGLSYTLKNYLLPMSGLSFFSCMICGWLPQAILGIPLVVMGDAAAHYSVILLIGLVGVYLVMVLSRKWIAKLYRRIIASAQKN